MQKRITLFFFLSFILLTATLAQKNFEDGYIVTVNNDTVIGQIDIKSNTQNSKSCLFFNSSDGTLQSLTPGDIKCFRTNNKYYIAKEVTIDSVRQTVFLEYLVDGIADLYYYRDPLNEFYFIEKDGILTELSNREITVLIEGGIEHNDRTFVKNSNQYMGVLNYLFQDGDGMAPRIARTDFQYRSLIDITKDYHNTVCKEYSCIDYTRSTNQKIFLELGLGVAFTQMTLKTSKDNLSSSSPLVSARLRFMPLKSNSRWNLTIGLTYSSSSHHGYITNDIYYYSSKDTFEITADYSLLRIPLQVQYQFGKGRFKPFISASYNGCILINSVYAAFIHLHNHNIPEYTPLRRYHHGISGAIGFTYSRGNKNYWYLKTEYEYRIPSANGHYVLDYLRNKTFMIDFGYAFSLSRY